MATTPTSTRPPGPLLWRRPGPCSVPPSAPRLQLGVDPRTTLAVSWSTFGPVERPVLELASGEVVPAESRVVPGTPTVYHHAVATGLTPGGIHQYRLAHLGATGRPRTLRTAPVAPGPLTFTAFGDHGVSDGAVAAATLVRQVSPALHLHAGGLAQAGAGTAARPGPQRDAAWDVWLAMVSSSLAERAPWMPVVGDHELGAGGDAAHDDVLARFTLPGNGAPGAPTTWGARHGNVGLVGLDSNAVSFEVALDDGPGHGAQDRWLDDALAGLRADPAVDWLVVAFHHCAYSTHARHASDGGVRRWAPILDRHGVDLVVNGHNPCYERTHAVRGGEVVAVADGHGSLEAGAGTVYVTAAASAGTVADGHDGWIPVGSELVVPGGGRSREAAGWSARRERGPVVLVVDVEPAARTLRLRALRPDGREIECLTLHRTGGPGAPSKVHRDVATGRPAVQTPPVR